MAGPASTTAVVAALVGNTAVTLIKVIAFLLSGSGAMLSEAIHSAADTGNQLLLFLGLKRGLRLRDDDFQYGYGGERFVFGLLSASGIFFVGCGVTVYHGISTLLHPVMPSFSSVTFVVLGVSFVIEGGVLAFAVRSVTKQRGEMRFFRYVRERADPATVAILLEDGAAVLGLVLAAIGIGAAQVTGNAVFDSLASILVGLVLGGVAIYLVLENRALLLGKAVPDAVEAEFLQVLRGSRSVRAVHDVKTLQLTPEAFKLKAEVTFDDAFLAEKLQPLLDGAAAAASPERLARDLAACALRTISEEIDAIEQAVRHAIPEAKHIDIEVDHARVDVARIAQTVDSGVAPP